MRTLIKTTLMLVVGMIITGGVAIAQPNRGDNRRGHGPNDRPSPPAVPDSAETVKLIDEVAEALTLTEDEKDAVLDLHLAHFAEVREVMEQSKGDRENHRKQMDALRDEFQEEMKALLSDEKYEEYEEYMKSHNPRPGQPGRRGK